MAEDLSIKVKVEPDVSDLSNKLKTAGNGVAPIPVKISLANIGDIKNKIATLGTTVDVGVNVKLNNTVDLNSIASNLDGKDIELSSKLKLDASDIQKELNRIGKTLKLNLKVNDDSGLIDKLEKSSNAVRESANKIQQAMNIKLKDGFKVTEKTVTSLSSGLEKIRLNIGKIKDTSAKNRLQKDYDALKSNFNTMLTGREISVLDFSGIQSGLTRLTEQCGDVLSAEKTVSDEATTMKKSLENALSGIKDKFSQTDYKGLGGDEAIKAIKQKFNQQITAANTAIGEYNNDPTATKYEAANKALQALVSTQNELNSTINTTVGESDKLLKRFEAVDNTATSIQTRFAGVDFGRFADVTSVKTASEDYTKKLEAVDAARTALNKNFSSENVDAYDAAVKALGDSLNDLVQKLTKARSALSGFDNIERRYNTAMKKNTTAQNAGYASLMNPESLTNLESAWAAAKKAREAFEADMSTSNLKAYDDAMYELDQSLQAFSSNVNKAKGSSDKAFDALPGKITALGKQMQTLQESTPETDEVKAVLAMYEAVYKRLVQINDVSKNTGVHNYEELNSAFKDFEYVGTNVNSTISSLDDLMKVLSANARSATHSVREFNAEAKKTRNTNTYEKSMQNTMYTAQRYFNNNSKISTNTEAYTRFVDFFNTYDEKIKSKMFTQENSNQMSKDWSELKKYIQDAGLETDKLSVKLKKLFEVNIKSQLANQVINAFQQGLRQVYQNVVDIDSAMTELKKVTDETSGAYSKFLSEAGDRAKTVGSTVSDIVNATADYARLGYNLDDAKTLADVSAVYYNVGDDLDSFTTATDNIVGTMKAFNLQADDAIGLVDKLNEVSNNFAVSSGDLGNILQRSASAMEAAGNTLDQTIALGTAMNSVLQSADTTGTTLKVLALRLRGASTELASMGEETDGVATSTSKLRAQIAALTNVDGSGGFDILTDSGAFKSTYDIIQGIAKVYDRMSDVDQASLLELIAGKNRANGVAALLKQASQAEDVLQTSLNSSGKQNCLYVQKCA
jgi:TP901 family phage tail tape measure protein